MKDHFGIEAKVGDEIVHVHTRSSSVYMKLGVVVEIGDGWLKWEWTDKVFTWDDDKHDKWHYENVKKITTLTARNFMVLSRYDLTA